MSAVEKWRANKAREAAAAARGDDTGASDANSSSTAASINESNRRRLEIQRKRREQRTNYESGSESEGVGSSRGAKFKAIQDRMKTPVKERLKRTLERSREVDSDEENKGNNGQDEEEEEDDGIIIIIATAGGMAPGHRHSRGGCLGL